MISSATWGGTPIASQSRLGLRTALQGLARADDGWVLTTSQGQLEAGRVVLATGACTEPHIPAWTGRDSFRPPLIHSSEYRRPGPYAGRRVLVVGSGNSATEVAVDLASSGVPVDLAVRTPPSILRRDFGGIPTQPLGFAMRYAPATSRRPPGRQPAPAEHSGPVGPGTAGAEEAVLSSNGPGRSPCWIMGSLRPSDPGRSASVPAFPGSTVTRSSTTTAPDRARTRSSPAPATHPDWTPSWVR